MEGLRGRQGREVWRIESEMVEGTGALCKLGVERDIGGN